MSTADTTTDRIETPSTLAADLLTLDAVASVRRSDKGVGYRHLPRVERVHVRVEPDARADVLAGVVERGRAAGFDAEVSSYSRTDRVRVDLTR